MTALAKTALVKQSSILSVAVVIALVLFLLMHLLIRPDSTLKKVDDSHTYLNFVRVDSSDQDVKTKKRQPPREPPQPETPPDTPNVDVPSQQNAASTSLSMNMPSIGLSINPGDGAFLGGLTPGGGMTGFDTDVIPLVRVPPVYPRRALMAKLQGTVTMEVMINPDGTVSDAKVLESNPARLFDSAALNAIKRWKFRPKIVNGSPVPQRARQTIDFKL